jgi:hypothetical protein
VPAGHVAVTDAVVAGAVGPLIAATATNRTALPMGPTVAHMAKLVT